MRDTEGAGGVGDGRAGPPASPRRRRGTVATYLTVLVVLFVAVAGASSLYQRIEARRDAEDAAHAASAFAAGQAARAIVSDVAAVRTVTAQTAATPGIGKVFEGPTDCTLAFGGASGFASGHLDVVSPTGVVGCSSLPVPAGSVGTPLYREAPWAAGRSPAPVVGPFPDARTGKLVVAFASPIATGGHVVAFIDLETAGPALAANFGGPTSFELLVVNDRDEILARSVDPGAWIGRSTRGTPFIPAVAPDPGGTTSDPAPAAGPGAAGGEAGADLDGRARLYGAAPVGGGADALGWTVYAGADRDAVLASSDNLARRGLLLNLGGLVLILGAALLIYRLIVRPLRDLSDEVRAATAHTDDAAIEPSGPAEIVSLAEDFRLLVATADSELRAMSQLAAIVESSGEAIIATTLDGTITSWNHAAETLYGHTADDMIGQDIATIVPPDRRADAAAHLERVAHGERVLHDESQHLHRNGSLVDVSVSLSPIRDPSGRVVGASALTRDLTASRLAAAEHRAMEDRLHQAERLESLGQLAGGIAHDFNNLLNVISGYAAFVASATADDPAVHQDVEEIRAAARSAARLTQQLLIFAKRETVENEILDLNTVVAQIHNLLARSIGEHIDLVADLAETLPAINADFGQVEQVLLNLAINARDAMPDGGTLTIATSSVHLDERRAAQHTGLAPGRYVELTVTDTGTGMSPEVAAHVFEPFFTTKPTGKGTGLGLATVYGIVTKAGGDVSVRSDEGQGTSIHVLLPAVSQPAIAETADEVVPPDTFEGHGETILVVEDEPAMMELTARMLRRHGYRVLEAATSSAALTAAGAHDVTLLLTDSVMPRLSGQQLARELLDVQPGMAVLFMSGYSHGAPAGAEDRESFIAKPFTEHDLLERVRLVIDRATPP